MSKRILVVEDQPDNRQIIRDMLAPTDYHEIEDKSRQLEEASQHKSQFLANMWCPIALGHYTSTQGRFTRFTRSAPVSERFIDNDQVPTLLPFEAKLRLHPCPFDHPSEAG